MKWVSILLLIISLIAGCGQITHSTSHGGQTKVQQTESSPANNKNYNASADHLAALAARVKGVQKATALVVNKVAIVGITVDDKLERSRVGTIKYSVAEALKEDPRGATALVTADPGLVQRVHEMKVDINKGHPVAGIAEELADIVGRIIPQSPTDVRAKQK